MGLNLEHLDNPGYGMQLLTQRAAEPKPVWQADFNLAHPVNHNKF